MIRHQPFGIEDPYNTQPWERSPRQPHEGDTVTVYAACEPNAFLTSVDVEVETNLGQNDCVSAVPAPLAGVDNRWKAEIGAFRRSEVVRYRFVTGSSDRSRLATEWFSFQTLGWRSLNRVSSWRATDSQVLLTLTDRSRTITTASFEVIAESYCPDPFLDFRRRSCRADSGRCPLSRYGSWRCSDSYCRRCTCSHRLGHGGRTDRIGPSIRKAPLAFVWESVPTGVAGCRRWRSFCRRALRAVSRGSGIRHGRAF